jgi:hypothetical protein
MSNLPITTTKLDASVYASFFGPPDPVPWGELHLDQAAGTGSLSINGVPRFGEICGGSSNASMNTADDFVLWAPLRARRSSFQRCGT